LTEALDRIMRDLTQARSTALFLFLLSTFAAAGQSLVAGPERLVGDASPRPWPRLAYARCLATNGDETVVVWFGLPRYYGYRDGYAVRLDRDGGAITGMPRQLLSGEQLRDPTEAPPFLTAIDGGYLLFFETEWHGLEVLRFSRELDVLERRVLMKERNAQVLRIADDFYVVRGGKTVIRLDRTLTPVGDPVVLPEAGAIVPAPDGRFAQLLVREPASTMRVYDGSTLGDLFRLDRASSSFLVWSGTEFVLVNGKTIQRLDRELRPAGTAVTLETTDTWIGSTKVESVTPLGDDVIWIQWSEDVRGSFGRRTLGQRFRRGQPADAKPIVTVSGAIPLGLADGRTLLIDPTIRVAVVPLPGSYAGSPLVWTAGALGAADEWLLAAGASLSEVAIVRYVGSVMHSASVLSHDLAPLREVPLGLGTVAGVASDGREMFVQSRKFLHALAGSAAPRYLELEGSPASKLAWTGSELATLWSTPFRIERLTRTGERLEPCPVPLPDHQFNWNDDARLTAGGDELLLTYNGRIAWIENGCATDVLGDPFLRYRHRLAWQDGRWAAAVVEGPGTIRVAIMSTNRGPFIPAPEPIATNAQLRGFAAVEGGWIVLYAATTGPSILSQKLFAAQLDRDGRVAGTTIIASGNDDHAELVTLPGRGLLAIYGRPVDGAPFFGVNRVFARLLTVEDGMRRRGVRH
jgi:hypothetical protein